MKNAVNWLVGCCLLTRLAFAQEVAYYVSPEGNAKNPGTYDRPFATAEQARNAIRKAKHEQSGKQYMVYFRAGTYTLTNPIRLTAADSGQPDKPVIYRSYEQEKVLFHGGAILKGTDFRVCNDPAILNRLMPDMQGKVWFIDLRKAGITDFGTMKKHGFGTPVEPTALELFIDGSPQTLARYPNVGFEKIGKIVDPGSKPYFENVPDRGAEFGYEYDRPNRWSQASDVFLHGHFSRGFNDDYLPVDHIDTVRKTIKLAQPHIYGVFSSLYVDKTKYPENAGLEIRGYYAYNLLEEIDQPGEWYLDRKTGKLYLYPPGPLTTATIVVSLSTQPLVELRNTANIRLEGIEFTCSRGMGIYLEHMHHLTVTNCSFSNLGTVAIAMNPLKGYNLGQDDTACHHNVVSNCTIFNTGTGGITLEGGDRKTLSSAHNEVLNCEFYTVDRVNKTYSAAISIRGVGATVRHCYFHDLKHWAINFTGNDHVIEYNRFERVCTNADDMGAVYTGRNPSARGTVIQYNYFAHNEPIHPGSGMCGVYIDDGSGGITVRNNLFYKTGSLGRGRVYAAVYIHGGHDNSIINNLFIACQAGVGQAAWDDARWASRILNNAGIRHQLAKEVDITSSLYQHRYPELINFLTNPGRRLNRVYENVAIQSPLSIQGDFLLRRNVVLFDLNASPQTIDYGQIATLIPAFKPFPLEKTGVQPSL
jgi:hypothetical protein